MIYGIGVDLVSIDRMEKALRKWGDRFIRRVFTELEVNICGSRAYPSSAFALRFAAKEAFSKAIGTGMKKGIRWQDIEVFHFPGGRPGLNLYGRSQELCKDAGVTGLHLSLSDERDYGVAMVVLEREDASG